MGKKSSRSSTPYDDVFKTMVVKGGRLVIPLINEMFHTEDPIDLDERIYNGVNEHFFDKGSGDQEKRETDSSIRIRNSRYHIECMCYEDGTIVIRMFEYAAQIAIENSTYYRNHLRVEFPHSGLLYLRRTSVADEGLEITVTFPEDKEVTYHVPVIQMSDYSLDDIIDRKLYFLLPFYMFNYEKTLYNKRYEEAVSAFDMMLTELNELYSSGDIHADEYDLIRNMTQKVVDSLMYGNPDVRKEMDEIMGGHVLSIPSDKYVKQGRKEGFEQGELIGRINVYMTDMHLSTSQISEKLGMEEDVITSIIAEILKEKHDKP